MILGFKTQIAGQPTFFVEKIRANVSPILANTWTPKIHTIRHGNRWRAGMKMQLAIGVRTKGYYQFNIGEYAALDHCVSVQEIEINHYIGSLTPEGFKDVYSPSVYVESEPPKCEFDGMLSKEDQELLGEKPTILYRLLSEIELEQLAKNDGFNSVEDFWNWFTEDFKGQIIHFTDFRY